MNGAKKIYEGVGGNTPAEIEGAEEAIKSEFPELQSGVVRYQAEVLIDGSIKKLHADSLEELKKQIEKTKQENSLLKILFCSVTVSSD